MAPKSRSERGPRDRASGARDSGRPGSPRARLFVALELPASAREALVAWRERALRDRDDLRAVAPEALHVTLVFIGYRAEKEIPAIAKAAFEPLRGLAPPLLVPAGVRAVGPKRAPRLFALDLADRDGRCAVVQAAASDGLEAARFYRPEKRPFWPHVTLTRVKRGAQAAPLDAEPPAIEPFTATTVTLYQSHLSPRGARYEALERIELG